MFRGQRRFMMQRFYRSSSRCGNSELVIILYTYYEKKYKLNVIIFQCKMTILGIVYEKTDDIFIKKDIVLNDLLTFL